jgi:O-acetyl-ADP-ribose deacetylase (regulator of RNase III)
MSSRRGQNHARHRLPARFVIHTVGPVWSGGRRGEAETLANCYRNSLRLAADNNLVSIAFPAISCGAYGYPIAEAARVAVEMTREFVSDHEKPARVLIVVTSEEILQQYRAQLEG